MGANRARRQAAQSKDHGAHRGAIADTAIAHSILIVDDNQDILYFMQSALESAGYRVVSAPDGVAARDLLARLRIDVLITDIFMPVQDGIETLRDCKTRSPDTRIIVMSAGSSSGRRLDYLPAAVLMGAHATLRKPFSLDQLLDVVHEVLQA